MHGGTALVSSFPFATTVIGGGNKEAETTAHRDIVCLKPSLPSPVVILMQNEGLTFLCLWSASPSIEVVEEGSHPWMFMPNKVVVFKELRLLLVLLLS